MSSATVQVLRSALTSGIGSKYWNLNASVYTPRDPLVTAPHLTEHLQVSPVSGALQPGGLAVFELPYEVDIIQRLNLQIRRDTAVLNGTATFVRAVDFYGIAMIEELLFRFGTERLQLVRPLELFIKLHRMFSDEDRSKGKEMVRGAIPANFRAAAAIAAPEVVILPLWTLLGVHLGGDPSQMLGVRMMAERFRLECRFAAANVLMESDGTYSFAAAGNVGQPPPAADAWLLADSFMYAEGKHLVDTERRSLEQIHRMPRRYLFRDAQYCTRVNIPGATSLAGTTFDIPLREINQPVVCLHVLFRWRADLERVDGGAGGSRGRNLFNTGGWFQPGGGGLVPSTAANQPIISHLEGRVGSNAFFLRMTRIEDILRYELARSYPCSGIEAGNAAFPSISFSHDAARENAQYVELSVGVFVCLTFCLQAWLHRLFPNGQPGSASHLQRGLLPCRYQCCSYRGHWYQLGSLGRRYCGHFRPAQLCQERGWSSGKFVGLSCDFCELTIFPLNSTTKRNKSKIHIRYFDMSESWYKRHKAQQQEKQAKYREQNPHIFKAHNEVLKLRYRTAMNAGIAKLGGKCVTCASTERLHFDHIDPTTKEFAVDKLAHSFRTREAQFWAEVAKCQLLCHSCHGKKSAREIRLGIRSGVPRKALWTDRRAPRKK